MRIRLCIMMFLQYFVMGATIPIMSLYLKDYLGFSGAEIGSILALSAIVALVSPVVGAVVADRWVSSERLLTICHLIGAVAMVVLIQQTEFYPFAGAYLAYTLCGGPTVALTNAIVFHNSPKDQRRFGNVRVWGTIGWIAVAWAFGYLWLNGADSSAGSQRLPDALKLSAASSVGLALYALSLPKAAFTKGTKPATIIPMASLRVFFKSKILFVGILSMLIAVVDRYYYFGMAPFMRHSGFSDTAILPVMSIGQAVEVVAMAMLATVLAKIGVKATLVLGVVAELWRFVAFVIGDSKMLIISGICCHGLAYAFFFTTVYIYIDGFCDRASRTGLHQIFSIITWGGSSLSANLLAGKTMDWFVIASDTANYRAFWLIPTGISLVSLAALIFFFKDRKVDGLLMRAASSS